MALRKKKSPQEMEAEQRQKQMQAAAREQAAFMSSPQGKARTAYQRGDLVFQYVLDVMTQSAVIAVMIGSATTKEHTDAVGVLNAVAREGWELVSGSFVFVHEGSQSRDKFMSSGQNLAVKGRTLGYYLFKRCPENRAGAPGSI